eukprot:1669703-Pyramimonas_sp.AAC.1
MQTTKRVRCVPRWVRQAHAGAASWAIGGAPYGARKGLRRVPKWSGGCMRALPVGSSAEPPFYGGGATHGRGGRMQALPFGPSVELPMGPPTERGRGVPIF